LRLGVAGGTKVHRTEAGNRVLVLRVVFLCRRPAQEVYFGQKHSPGRLCASDFTHMTELGITLAGQTFEHLVYHFVLTYSNWRLVCRKRPFRGRRIHVRPELIVRHF
jgi:hypothetical protein